MDSKEESDRVSLSFGVTVRQRDWKEAERTRPLPHLSWRIGVGLGWELALGATAVVGVLTAQRSCEEWIWEESHGQPEASTWPEGTSGQPDLTEETSVYLCEACCSLRAALQAWSPEFKPQCHQKKLKSRHVCRYMLSNYPKVWNHF
jgi:hypothetical protein